MVNLSHGDACAPRVRTRQLAACETAQGCRRVHRWRAALFPTQARFAANVVGTLHEAGKVDLAAIDAFATGAYATGDFVRQLVEVDGWSGAGDMADTYIWSGDLPDRAEPVGHGDFARWLEETGRRPA